MRIHIPTTSIILLSTLLLLGSCDKQDQPLQLSDLSASERLYFERVIAMERARTLGLIYRDVGEALLDSLGVAWGDSIGPEIRAGLTSDPYRSQALGELLLRVVTAEQDSLKWDPGTSRLHMPLPDPNRRGREHTPVPKTAPGDAAPRP